MKWTLFFQPVTNSFQCIIATDYLTTYTVFIYECGEMEWGGGIIGWQASASEYTLSDMSYFSDVACPSNYTAIVYRISRKLFSEE